MHILVDENIPDAIACFEQFGQVTSFNGRELSDLGDADVLITRSVTKVGEALCNGSKLRFVGSTTIGTDHLDKDWLERAGIVWCNAPGSNANSVADYVVSAIAALTDGQSTPWRAGRAGIVGFGNVGKRVALRLAALGYECHVFDPFVVGTAFDGYDRISAAALEEVMQVDLLCLHTPLTTTGDFPTFHMINSTLLGALNENAILLNAGRGEVVATKDLLALKQARPDVRLVLDVWESEPAINHQLAEAAAIATPHIAGYSIDGKRNGLRQIAESLAQFLGRPLLDWEQSRLPAPTVHRKDVESTVAAILACYDVRADHQLLRDCVARTGKISACFDKQRKQYPLRRELQYCQLEGFSVEERAQLLPDDLPEVSPDKVGTVGNC